MSVMLSKTHAEIASIDLGIHQIHQDDEPMSLNSSSLLPPSLLHPFPLSRDFTISIRYIFLMSSTRMVIEGFICSDRGQAVKQ